jgi:hypothetical protein
MIYPGSMGAWARKTAPLVAALTMAFGLAAVAQEGKYPDWKGQWDRQRVSGLAGQPSFDPNKSWGRGQEAPLTPEYQAVLESNLKSQAEGGFFDWLGASCRGFGMPLVMYAYQPLEFIITPETSYVLVDWVEHTRRIYTDGRDWPKEIEPTLVGYSIGKWLDTDGDGRFDTLEVETRGFKGPRHYDAAGLPLHHDNRSVFKERIYLDKTDKTIMRDEITVYDHAPDAALDRDARLRPQPRPATPMARIHLRRRQFPHRHRQGELFPERRRPADAGAQGPGAARHALFQADQEVTPDPGRFDLRSCYRTVAAPSALDAWEDKWR